jgi:hypothetical protein
MRKILPLLIAAHIFAFCKPAAAQVHSFDIGLRFQKSIGLYYENGITGQYNLTRRWALGVTYITSRLGTAWGTNAIKQDNILASGTYKFRPAHALQPFLRGNLGYFTADYGSPMFDSLPHTSAIVSVDGGISYQFKLPVKVNLSLGYNAITGNGASGAGTLYPVFYQLSVTYNIAKL